MADEEGAMCDEVDNELGATGDGDGMGDEDGMVIHTRRK